MIAALITTLFGLALGLSVYVVAPGIARGVAHLLNGGPHVG